MKQWKKILLGGLVSVVMFSIAIAFVGCAEKEITCTFYTYDGQSVTTTGKKGEQVTFPEVSRDDYIFDGWYADAEGTGSPVTSATYEEDTSYYAKWAAACIINLDLDGGSLSVTELKAKAGTDLYTFMQNYVPVKGEYRFGGWYIGEEKLEKGTKLTAAGVTLTAKYMASYTVNVYLQNEALTEYVAAPSENVTGYALIGEEFTPEINIKGFTLSSDDDDSFIIDETGSKNVYDFHFDRNEYTLTLLSNYPDGPAEFISEKHYFGVEFSLPENTFAIEGSRFIGWATSATATYEDVITEDKYVLSDDTDLYAIWNVGYSDMFGGHDYIYVTPGDSTSAVLCRGGIDIAGSYDERRNFYKFSSPTTSYELRARLNDNGTFVFYADRQGTYKLYEKSAINEHVQIIINQTNGIEYSSDAPDNKFYKEGTYTILESGYYEATFEDESFIFSIGTAGGKQVFRIRGEEVDYGVLAYLGKYYPAVVLDGFGVAAFIQSKDEEPIYLNYTIKEDIVTLSNAGSSLVVRILKYGDTFGFDYYVQALDGVYVNKNGDKLELNGCTTAVITVGGIKTEGSFVAEQSIFGGYIIRVTANSVKYVYRAYTLSNLGLFETKESDYAEYMFVDNEGAIKRAPYLVNNGDGTADTYEVRNNSLEKTSSGTLVVQPDKSYLYTVDENGVAEWAETRISVMVVNLDASSTKYSVYYYLSAETEEGDSADYVTTYTLTLEGKVYTLKKISAFIVLTYPDGSRVTGVYTEYPNYIRVTLSGGYAYFILDDENKTFEIIREPLVLTMRKNNLTTRTTTVTITGRGETVDGVVKYEAIYTERVDGKDVSTHGYYTDRTVEIFGAKASVNTFVSDDGTKTFKFLAYQSGSNLYFTPYEADEVIEIEKFTAINDDDAEDTSVTLAATDEMSGDNVVFVFNDGEKTVKGVVTSQIKDVFDEYEVTVFTFTSLDSATTFKFTLLNNYFRIEATDGSYTGNGRLELDGATHIARYIDAEGRYHVSRYLIVKNVLNEGDIAITMSVNDVMCYFDINSTNNTFTLRGAEAAGYLVIDNGTLEGTTVILDGYGHATLKAGEESEEVSATYTVEGDVYTISFENGSYVGKLGTITVDKTTYNTFVIEIKGVEGTYLNKSDLSVLVLDSVGNVTKYNSYGVSDTGSYIVLDDNLIYYTNSKVTDAALYTIDGGNVVAADYTATYYSDDFHSIVFYVNGVVRYNNTYATYFTYNKADGTIKTYTQSDDAAANKYGYLVEDLSLSDGTITYTDDKGVTRNYSLFDGKYVTFTDDNGGTLEFQPAGGATFKVIGNYTENGAEKAVQYYVVVECSEEGEVTTYLSNYEQKSLNGSRNAYSFTNNYDLELHFDTKKFVFDKSVYKSGLSAYDYNYLMLLSTYGSALAPLFANQLGLLEVVGTVENGNTTYSVSGTFNYIRVGEALDKALTFTGGTLTPAGYYNQYYGHLYTSEFVGNDNKTYHLNFYITADKTTGLYTYIIYSLTRVTDSLNLAEDSVIYTEEYVYTTGFKFVKSKDQNGDPVYYEIGDEFIPSIKYKGVMINTFNWSESGDSEWLFMSVEYNGKEASENLYYFTYTKDAEGKINGGTIVKRITEVYKTADGVSVYVIRDDGTEGISGIYEVYGFMRGEEAETTTDCVKVSDGVFTVTTEKGVYTVTFTAATGDEGETVISVEVVKQAEEGGAAA